MLIRARTVKALRLCDDSLGLKKAQIVERLVGAWLAIVIVISVLLCWNLRKCALSYEDRMKCAKLIGLVLLTLFLGRCVLRQCWHSVKALVLTCGVVLMMLRL